MIVTVYPRNSYTCTFILCKRFVISLYLHVARNFCARSELINDQQTCYISLHERHATCIVLQLTLLTMSLSFAVDRSASGADRRGDREPHARRVQGLPGSGARLPARVGFAQGRERGEGSGPPRRLDSPTSDRSSLSFLNAKRLVGVVFAGLRVAHSPSNSRSVVLLL